MCVYAEKAHRVLHDQWCSVGEVGEEAHTKTQHSDTQNPGGGTAGKFSDKKIGLRVRGKKSEWY